MAVLSFWTPPTVCPYVMKNNGFIPDGEETPERPTSSSSCSSPRQSSGKPTDDCWVASGLCALSVIKRRKKVYGLLVSEPPTDGMSSKHPPIPNLLRDWGGVWRGAGRGQQSAHGPRDRAVQLDNLTMKQVKWVKLKPLINIYAHIYIMLMRKRWRQMLLTLRAELCSGLEQKHNKSRHVYLNNIKGRIYDTCLFVDSILFIWVQYIMRSLSLCSDCLTKLLWVLK